MNPPPENNPIDAVAEIFRSKPDQAVYKIAPGVSVYDALRLMAGKNTTSAP